MYAEGGWKINVRGRGIHSGPCTLTGPSIGGSDLSSCERPTCSEIPAIGSRWRSTFSPNAPYHSWIHLGKHNRSNQNAGMRQGLGGRFWEAWASGELLQAFANGPICSLFQKRNHQNVRIHLSNLNNRKHKMKSSYIGKYTIRSLRIFLKWK